MGQGPSGLVPLHAVFATHGDLANQDTTLTDHQVARRAAVRLADPILFTPDLRSWRSVQRFVPPGEDSVYYQLLHLVREGDGFVVRVGGLERRAGEAQVNLDDFASWGGAFEVSLPCQPFQEAYERALRWLGR
jgi:hypothetical protein